MDLFPEMPLALMGFGVLVLGLKVYAERISPGRVPWNDPFVQRAVFAIAFSVLWLVVGAFYLLVSN